MRTRIQTLLLVGGLIALVLPSPAEAGRRRGGNANHEPVGHQLFASPQVNPLVLSNDGSLLYVAATTSNRIDVFDTTTHFRLATIAVGIDPVSLAMRPDGLELWVSSHVSDAVNVIDTGPSGATRHQIIATIQDVDAAGVTQFDEPVGIAFTEDGKKAYVALSSRNDIAVVDTSLCDAPCSPNTVTNRIHITAQDPRAIAVRGNRLYVAAFEGGNQSELSLCPGQAPTNDGQCSMDETAIGEFVTTPNIPNQIKNIVRDPDVPDRDLFVYDTTNDTLVDTVSGVGTLLYGIAVDVDDRVYISQTEALNDVNGISEDLPGPPAGPEHDLNGDGVVNLDDLGNRMFLNQIAILDCGGASCTMVPGSPVDLEPTFPDPATALATPYGIAVTTDTGNNTTLVATAAGTNRVFTATDSGTVLSQLDVGANPRGLALRTDAAGAPQTAYVLNTLGNTVTVVDVSNPLDLPGSNPSPALLPVGGDPTPTNVRLGRIAFNDAFASDSGTFSCASCHPDGNTDQLLWRIGGRNCVGCTPDEDEARSTMPVRGLKNTLPLHWDGTLGDPFGGTNGQGGSGTTCALGPVGDPDRDHACFRDLVDESLSGVMCDQTGGCQVSADQSGPDGSNLPGQLTDTERENMAFFLASVAYPPARSRAVDDFVSASALQGFSDFFVDRPGGSLTFDVGDLIGISTCADMDSGCHALPLGTDTNSATVGGFDAPTMRGMTDRFLHFSIGITIPEEAMLFTNVSQTITIPGLPFPVITPPADVPYDPADGLEEDAVFSAAFAIFQPIYAVLSLDMFQMFEEASTGFAGATGRQVTLTPASVGLSETIDAMSDLEAADAAGLVNLRATGRLNGVGKVLSFRAETGTYRDATMNVLPAGLRSMIDAANDAMTLTAELRSGVGTTPQPLLSVNANGEGPTGNPDLPVLPGDNPMTLEGIDVHQDAVIVVDGQPVSGIVACLLGSFTPYCDSELVAISLDAIPSPNGLHLLQVQNPEALLSNELPICVGAASDCQ